jgi:hypothetical protein
MNQSLILKYLILSVFIVIIAESASYVMGKYLESKGVFYKPTFKKDYGTYLKERDEVLGWPSKKSFGKDGQRDSTGSRIIPEFPDPLKHTSCVSLYGNSFTWSAEVDNEHAWSNVLSQLLNCRVANYGAGGYGTDQAYLRFLTNSHDSSKVVILSHLSENILRNVNQFRGLLYPQSELGFKPRFILDNNHALKLIPLPTFTPDEYINVLKHPQQYLKYEYFIPGGPSGIQLFRFPYTWSVIKSIKNFHIYPKLSGKSWYSDFYEYNHPSHGLSITTEIMRAFIQGASEKGKIPVTMIIPTGYDLRFYKEKGQWPYQNLINSLHEHGITPINAGDSIMDYLKGRNPCELFTLCHAHYNEEGYRVIATIVYEYLTIKENLFHTNFHSSCKNKIKKCE